MQLFYNLLSSLNEYQTLKACVTAKQTPACVTGACAVHKAHLISALTKDFSDRILVLAEDEGRGRRLLSDINTLYGSDIAVFYPERDFIFTTAESLSHEYEHERLSALIQLMDGKARVLISTVSAAMQLTIDESTLRERSIPLQSGSEISTDALVTKLMRAGYVNRPQVDGIGQFAKRGGIIDIFPPSSKGPVRVEFWGDVIDTISYFDMESQRRTVQADSINLTPAREVLPPSIDWLCDEITMLAASLKGKQAAAAREQAQKDIEKLKLSGDTVSFDKFLPRIYQPTSLFDYFNNAMLMVSEFADIREQAKGFSWRHQQELIQLFDDGVLFAGLDNYALSLSQVISILEAKRTVIFNTFARSMNDFPIRTLINITATQGSCFSAQPSQLIEDVDVIIAKGYACIVMAASERACHALCDDLIKAGFDAVQITDRQTLSPRRVYIMTGTLSASFEYPDLKLSLISCSGVEAQAKRSKKKHKKPQNAFDIGQVEVGDYVVHVSHGIGIFEGIQKLEVQGVVKDYIKIKYGGSDVLYVPVTQLDLVSKYIGGGEDGAVKLNRLNSVTWQNTKSRVQRAVKDMAKELIALYAKRMQVKGFAFSADNDWQADFEERFEYEETDDQLRCVEEIKQDMERSVPMDRLLCGDVGFGKTEVALRAAFKCIMDSKQCAILVPTTILAWQHYKTILSRMESFPINVELLSRFRTPKQQEEIIRRLKRGEIDLVVGTHRLVQKDVSFKDLGLVIIDEEQRFGVAHKEKFKTLFSNVDVLTLSATPIPRTLNMAMSGIRDMSVIEEAPLDRHPVQTYVIEHDDRIVFDAIKKEVRRGGQVYYLHNRVDSIEACAAKIQRAIPEYRVGFAHGKMSQQELEQVWKQLMEHEIDVLVCTTIIETGVDVANCNTLVIEDADHLGLSQLYQIRGRVGRSTRRSYAYLTFRRGKVLTEIAAKRLAAIREFTAFGSGFRIAMRDLEIRGAGNILGAQQHGHMEAVGYDLYLRLLSQAVLEEKGESAPLNQECLVDIRITAHIPHNYISNLSQRVDIYRKIAMIQNNDDAMDVTDELIDRFGEPPKEVLGLIDVALLRNQAARLGITEISQKEDYILLYQPTLNMEAAGKLAAQFRGKVLVSAGAKPYISVKLDTQEDNIACLKAVLNQMLT